MIVKLEKMINCFDAYQKRFSEWEADEKIFDDLRAFLGIEKAWKSISEDMFI